MTAYIIECDRQLKVYGTRNDAGGAAYQAQKSPMQQKQPPADATAEIENQNTPGTPQNTPAYSESQNNNNSNGNGNDHSNSDNSSNNNVLLCPRGLAAIPLLCAAAAESRSAYLARLQVTHPSNGWWAKQEVLCLEPNNPLSIPEKLVIGCASQIEKLSLVVSNYMGETNVVSIMSPRVLQAFLWPVHNVFLCTWICLILTTTYLGSLVMMIQTLLFGAKRTNAPLGRLFMEEISPSARACESLCEQHQVIGVRVTGLILMPLMIICDFATSIVRRVNTLFGSVVFVGMGLCSWWYWVSVVHFVRLFNCVLFVLPIFKLILLCICLLSLACSFVCCLGLQCVGFACQL
jgi:hypothetical protein